MYTMYPLDREVEYKKVYCLYPNRQKAWKELKEMLDGDYMITGIFYEKI